MRWRPETGESRVGTRASPPRLWGSRSARPALRVPDRPLKTREPCDRRRTPVSTRGDLVSGRRSPATLRSRGLRALRDPVTTTRARGAASPTRSGPTPSGPAKTKEGHPITRPPGHPAVVPHQRIDCQVYVNGAWQSVSRFTAIGHQRANPASEAAIGSTGSSAVGLNGSDPPRAS